MALPLISPAGSEAHEPELRRVTVLFADIQGSTALIQDLDPEDAAGLIDPALHAMIDAAERFDGVVSHRGDGIMAIFGAPSVSEDHGIRACLAALTMRDALTGGAASAGVQTTAVGAVRGVAKVDRRARAVQLRIGIHVGDVVFRPVRIGGAWTQDAVGIAVHVAARLEQSAAPGTICLSGAVVQATSGFVRVGRLDAMMVKGVDAPIDRYELIEADRTANRWTVRAARGLTRFAGRQAELAVLDAALAEDGRRVVHIHGAAGLGKSRVLHEFLETSAARSCHVVALVGDHHRRFVPFHPVASWLRIWLDIRPIENPVEARAELARKLAALDPMPSLAPDLLARVLNIAEAEPWTGAIGALAAVDFGTPIAALLRALAAGRRTILICEDADSFDPATQDLVNDALARLAADDVLAVTASRVPVRFAALTVAETRIISLGPLSPEDAAGMLGGIDPRFRARPALAATIIDKAAGNPLFIEEVAAAMPATAATVPLDALADIPDRVEALIADRLARLPRPLRRLVELGAVIGVDVPMPLLALLADVEPAALYPLLLRLQAEQIMYETGKYPDPVFSFKHALTRDVAYSAMLAARRRGHHARIVALLEAEGEAARARNIDDLSMHALHARLWEPAVRYLQQTARQAVGRSANRSALSALSRARDVAAKELPDTAEAVRMRLDLLLNRQVLVLQSGH